MRRFRRAGELGDIAKRILFSLIFTFISSCVQTTSPITSQKTFYTIPEITYLRASPGHEETVLSQLHRGDQVLVVEAGDSAWWRVQQLPDGKTGWLPQASLSSEPVTVNYYYVAVDSISLLACPRDDCPAIQKLFWGDRVSKLAENDQGWLRVQASGNNILGWLPAAALTEQFADSQKRQPGKEYFYVAVRKLGLRAKPWIKEEIIKTLQFNEQVQKISQNSLGWFKVRQPSSGALGWVHSRYLEPLPLAAPRSEVPAKPKPGPLKRKESPESEPEIM